MTKWHLVIPMGVAHLVHNAKKVSNLLVVLSSQSFIDFTSDSFSQLEERFTNIKPSWINEYRIERVKESSLSLWWSLENIFRLFGPQYHNTIPECPLKKSGSKSDPVLL